MNTTIRKAAVATVVAGSLAFFGCKGKYNYNDPVRATSSTGQKFYILARPSKTGCLVSLHRGIQDKDSAIGDFGEIYPEDIISNPTEVKALLVDNSGAFKAAIRKGCKTDSKVELLVEQNMVEIQRQ